MNAPRQWAAVVFLFFGGFSAVPSFAADRSAAPAVSVILDIHANADTPDDSTEEARFRDELRRRQIPDDQPVTLWIEVALPAAFKSVDADPQKFIQIWAEMSGVPYEEMESTVAWPKSAGRAHNPKAVEFLAGKLAEGKQLDQPGRKKFAAKLLQNIGRPGVSVRFEDASPEVLEWMFRAWYWRQKAYEALMLKSDPEMYRHLLFYLESVKREQRLRDTALAARVKDVYAENPGHCQMMLRGFLHERILGDLEALGVPSESVILRQPKIPGGEYFRGEPRENIFADGYELTPADLRSVTRWAVSYIIGAAFTFKSDKTRELMEKIDAFDDEKLEKWRRIYALRRIPSNIDSMTMVWLDQ